MRRLAALVLAVLGQAVLASLDVTVAAVPAFLALAGATLLVLDAAQSSSPNTSQTTVSIAAGRVPSSAATLRSVER
jgi:hypothetical protein